MDAITKDVSCLSDTKMAQELKRFCGTRFPVINPSEYPNQIDFELRGTGLHKIPAGCVEFKREEKRWYVKTIKSVSFQLLQNVNNLYSHQVRMELDADGTMHYGDFLLKCGQRAREGNGLSILLSQLYNDMENKSLQKTVKKHIEYLPMQMKWHVDTVEGLTYLATALRRYYSH
ncbi:MAG: hypothetical protein FWG80_00775 [Alphaproteobacteria bacterium]|nr:hypothetical protein [Alphaproteobacteria bacterium]